MSEQPESHYQIVDLMTIIRHYEKGFEPRNPNEKIVTTECIAVDPVSKRVVFRITTQDVIL